MLHYLSSTGKLKIGRQESLSLMDKQRCERYCYQNIRILPQREKSQIKKLRLVLFDMDGVLTDTISSWRYIHNHFGVSNERSVQAYISGEIDDSEFIRRDVDLWRKDDHLISLEEITDLLKEIPLMTGAKECIAFLHKHDIDTAIVSAGLDILANRVALDLGIDHVYANGIEVDHKGILTTNGIVRVPLMHKDKVVQKISKELAMPLYDIAAVGNSCYDIPMLQMASLGIAFDPSDICVCEKADLIVMGKDLRELLPVFKPYL